MSQPPRVIPEKAIGFKAHSQIYLLDPKKALLYNVSLGYSEDPLNKTDLQFTYELSEEFKICPSLATTKLDLSVMFECLQTCPGIPEFNPMLLLHGE